MTRSKFLASSLAAGAAFMFCHCAAAQEIIPFTMTKETNLIGLGVFSVPDYYGSDDYEAKAAPLLHYNFGDNGMYVQLVGPEIRLNLVPRGLEFMQGHDFRAGPLLRFRQRRDDDVSDNVVKHMRPIASASEIGFFAQYNLPIDPNQPLHKISFRGDFTYNTTHVYNGATGNINATYWYPFPSGIMGYPLLGTLGFGLFFGSDHFANKYFGVGQTDTPLFPNLNGFRYKASGGLVSIKVPFALTSQIDPKWLVTVAGRYERLLGDAADSPVVSRRGSENQWTIGIAGSYLF
jgi:outer membrane scaffolding protein for murein synthesis (MipA/OmpV family)